MADQTEGAAYGRSTRRRAAPAPRPTTQGSLTASKGVAMGDYIHNQEHVAEHEPTQEERRAEGGGQRGRAPGNDVTPELKARLTRLAEWQERDRKSTRLNSSHVSISYAVFCL